MQVSFAIHLLDAYGVEIESKNNSTPLVPLPPDIRFKDKK